MIDASVALPWFFADEKSEESERILAEIYRNGATVPVLWPIEVGNALTMGLCRRRLSEPDWLKSLTTLACIPVAVESLDHLQALSNVPPLAQKHDLTFYDAMYLELAIRLSLPLATFDSELARAARLANVRLWNGD
ncbi:MAG: type II toxin-antitoxin system VapC family toxin [Tepidisphaeraceae bacterium]